MWKLGDILLFITSGRVYQENIFPEKEIYVVISNKGIYSLEKCDFEIFEGTFSEIELQNEKVFNFSFDKVQGGATLLFGKNERIQRI